MHRSLLVLHLLSLRHLRTVARETGFTIEQVTLLSLVHEKQDDFLTPKDAAQLLDVTISTLRTSLKVLGEYVWMPVKKGHDRYIRLTEAGDDTLERIARASDMAWGKVNATLDLAKHGDLILPRLPADKRTALKEELEAIAKLATIRAKKQEPRAEETVKTVKAKPKKASKKGAKK